VDFFILSVLSVTSALSAVQKDILPDNSKISRQGNLHPLHPRLCISMNYFLLVNRVKCGKGKNRDRHEVRPNATLLLHYRGPFNELI
jgi:hypothetical protein